MADTHLNCYEAARWGVPFVVRNGTGLVGGGEVEAALADMV